jgi:hypothetical protein
MFNEFKAHGNNKDENFSEIKILASIFRKKWTMEINTTNC